MSLEKTIQQINNEKVRLNKTIEFNKILKDLHLDAFIEPEYNRLILCSTTTGKPIMCLFVDAINKAPYLLDKLTELKPVFESMKNILNHMSYGSIYLNSNEFKFIYKNTIIVTIEYIKGEPLKVESHFKLQQKSCHIQFDKGDGILYINAGFNSKEDVTYHIKKQISLQELDTTILDEMREETITIFKKNLNINVTDYPQSKYTNWD